jgi:hypothetical protein
MVRPFVSIPPRTLMSGLSDLCECPDSAIFAITRVLFPSGRRAGVAARRPGTKAAGLGCLDVGDRRKGAPWRR